MPNDPRVVLKWTMDLPQKVFDMPEGSDVIEVRTQHGHPTLWTLGPEPGGPTEERTFVACSTGGIVPESVLYVGSAHDVADQGLVFHVFERTT